MLASVTLDRWIIHPTVMIGTHVMATIDRAAATRSRGGALVGARSRVVVIPVGTAMSDRGPILGTPMCVMAAPR